MSEVSTCPGCRTSIPANLSVGYHGRCKGCMQYEYCIVLVRTVPEGTYEWRYRRQQGLPADHVAMPHWTPSAAPEDSEGAINNDTVTDQEAAVLKVLDKHYPCRRTIAQIAEEIVLSGESVNDYLLKLQDRKVPLVTTPKGKSGRTLTDAGRYLVAHLSDAAGAGLFRPKTR